MTNYILPIFYYNYGNYRKFTEIRMNSREFNSYFRKTSMNFTRFLVHMW
jgi:hypothetical protein